MGSGGNSRPPPRPPLPAYRMGTKDRGDYDYGYSSSMTTHRNAPRSSALDPTHIPELPFNVLSGLLTTHLGRLAAKRGEVLLTHEREQITRYCYALAVEMRMRGDQLRIF